MIMFTLIVIVMTIIRVTRIISLLVICRILCIVRIIRIILIITVIRFVDVMRDISIILIRIIRINSIMNMIMAWIMIILNMVNIGRATNQQTYGPVARLARVRCTILSPCDADQDHGAIGPSCGALRVGVDSLQRLSSLGCCCLRGITCAGAPRCRGRLDRRPRGGLEPAPPGSSRVGHDAQGQLRAKRAALAKVSVATCRGCFSATSAGCKQPLTARACRRNHCPLIAHCTASWRMPGGRLEIGLRPDRGDRGHQR